MCDNIMADHLPLSVKFIKSQDRLLKLRFSLQITVRYFFPCYAKYALKLTIYFVIGAPAKNRVGFGFGGSGETNWTGGLSGQGTLDDKLFHGSGTGLIGASGKGELHGGGFAQHNDKTVATDGEIHGNLGGLVKSNFEGDAGVDKDGNAKLGGTNRLTSAGKFGGGASGGVYNDQDALPYVKQFGGRSAMDDLDQIMY